MTVSAKIFIVVLFAGISLYKVNPIVSERFSVESGANNDSIVSRDVINRVHHQHEQNIGNIHVLTHINIENVITIRNESNPNNSSHPADTPGKWY